MLHDHVFYIVWMKSGCTTFVKLSLSHDLPASVVLIHAIHNSSHMTSFYITDLSTFHLLFCESCEFRHTAIFCIVFFFCIIYSRKVLYTYSDAASVFMNGSLNHLHRWFVQKHRFRNKNESLNCSLNLLVQKHWLILEQNTTTLSSYGFDLNCFVGAKIDNWQ